MKIADLRARAQVSALRLLLAAKGKKPLPKELAEHVASLFARHCSKDVLATTSNGRLQLSLEARNLAWWVGKRVAWMNSPINCHGQQAAEYAKATLADLRKKSLPFEALVERCEEFGRLRKRHIDRNNVKRARRTARSVELETSGMTARWLASESQIDQTGHRMKNCLANKAHSQAYKSRFRKREIDLVVLEDGDGSPLALLCIATDGTSLEEVKGPANDRPLQCREAIVELLGLLGCSVGECQDALNLGVCDRLVRERTAEESTRITVAGRVCEIGSGFFALTWEDNCFLLRANEYFPWEYDYCAFHPDDSGYLVRAGVRVWLRDACRGNRRLARACAAAFVEAPEVFRLDWFGTR